MAAAGRECPGINTCVMDYTVPCSRAGDGSVLDDDTEGSGDFKAWEAKFRCTNLRTAKKHSVGKRRLVCFIFSLITRLS